MHFRYTYNDITIKIIAFTTFMLKETKKFDKHL